MNNMSKFLRLLALLLTISMVAAACGSDSDDGDNAGDATTVPDAGDDEPDQVDVTQGGTLAKELIAESCAKQQIELGELTLHADRGPPMTSKTLALKLADLGVTKSHSRPYTSNDNPFSESQFRTMKYRPGFPARFGSIEDARAYCRALFD